MTGGLFFQYELNCSEKLNSSGPSGPVRGVTESYASCPSIRPLPLPHPFNFSLHEGGRLFGFSFWQSFRHNHFKVQLLTTTLLSTFILKCQLYSRHFDFFSRGASWKQITSPWHFVFTPPALICSVERGSEFNGFFFFSPNPSVNRLLFGKV